MTSPLPKSGIWLTCLLVLSSQLAVAQYTKVELVAVPTPPLPAIAKVPDGVSWTIDYKYVWEFNNATVVETPAPADQGTPNRPDPNETLVEAKYYHYSSGILEEETTLKNRSKDKRYFVKKFVIVGNPQTGFIVEPMASFFEDTVFRPNEFNEFEWLKTAVFAGEAVYQGVLCNVYRQLGADSMPIKSAFISKERRLPVGLEDIFGIKTYRFKEDKTPIALPPAALQAVEQTMAPPKASKRYKIPQ